MQVNDARADTGHLGTTFPGTAHEVSILVGEGIPGVKTACGVPCASPNCDRRERSVAVLAKRMTSLPPRKDLACNVGEQRDVAQYAQPGGNLSCWLIVEMHDCCRVERIKVLRR